MYKRLRQKFSDLERGRVGRFGNDISTPATRRMAMWHFNLFDHAFLRVLWTNQYEVGRDVWRSNQPSPRRIKKLAEMGIKTIVTLRGQGVIAFNLLEKEACDVFGINYVHMGGIAARVAAPASGYLALLDFFDDAERPFLFHCKSGADRAGLAAAFYLLHIEKYPLSEARKQLSWKHMHLKSTKTGVLDHILDHYEADMNTHGEMSLREWLIDHYDHETVNASFNKLLGNL